jgi:uncharacterized protein with NAD-binding domain and iron-sulfur cluster
MLIPGFPARFAHDVHVSENHGDAGDVLVLGGGVAGMTAAHELAERGFNVTVLERHHIPGGKARSMPAPGTGIDGRPDLPAEHGFRFFPGFYKHVPDTMRRIPSGSSPHCVFDHLVSSTKAEMARVGAKAFVMPARFPQSVNDLRLLFTDAFFNDLGIPIRDQLFFLKLLLKLLGSCDERRYGEYEYQSWLEFTDSAHRSPAYQNFLAKGLTRTLVAARAEIMSARTGGYILLQLLFDLASYGTSVDRVLDGPTNEVWIQPWLSHLDSLGVTYQEGAKVAGLRLDGKRVAGVQVQDGAELKADWVVCALPVEVASQLITDGMKEVDPRLASLELLQTRWMNGVMFYLTRDVPLVHGHMIYIDSPWALTSISQAQFWPDVDLTARGNGQVRDILSVDVSEWEQPGTLYGKPAMQCSKDEIIAEVWAQLKAHLDTGGGGPLQDGDRVGWFVDRDIRYPNPREDINLEPLLVNTAGSWDHRPDVATKIGNFFLASDYVRTYTDLATMEGANEAARRAVNAILDATGSREPKCTIWPLHEPALFAPMRALDRIRYQREHGAPAGGRPGPGPGN